MWLGTLCTGLLGNLSTDESTIRAGESIINWDEGTIRAGEVTIRAGQDV